MKTSNIFILGLVIGGLLSFILLNNCSERVEYITDHDTIINTDTVIKRIPGERVIVEKSIVVPLVEVDTTVYDEITCLIDSLEYYRKMLSNYNASQIATLDTVIKPYNDTLNIHFDMINAIWNAELGYSEREIKTVINTIYVPQPRIKGNFIEEFARESPYINNLIWLCVGAGIGAYGANTSND